jgi:hypothetical protein
MSPYSSNTSSSNPDIQQQYAQQQAERQRATQQRAAQNPPVVSPPEKVPRMVQVNRRQQDAVLDEMDIDTGEDEVRAPKRKREEEGEPMDGEDRAAKKIRLDPPPEAGPDVRLVARGDMAMPVPAIPTAPLTSKALKKAIRSEDLATGIHLLDAGVSMDTFDAIDKRLEKVLMYAAKKGSGAFVRELLRRGVDVNTRDNQGYTALMYAARVGNKDAVMVLLEAGASTNLRNRDESLAITEAVYGGSAAIVQALIEHGADINKQDKHDGMTALMTAADENEYKIFSILLNAQADIHLEANNGLTALAYAVKTGNVAML